MFPAGAILYLTKKRDEKKAVKHARSSGKLKLQTLFFINRHNSVQIVQC